MKKLTPKMEAALEHIGRFGLYPATNYDKRSVEGLLQRGLIVRDGEMVKLAKPLEAAKDGTPDSLDHFDKMRDQIKARYAEDLACVDRVQEIAAALAAGDDE